MSFAFPKKKISKVSFDFDSSSEEEGFDSRFRDGSTIVIQSALVVHCNNVLHIHTESFYHLSYKGDENHTTNNWPKNNPL